MILKSVHNICTRAGVIRVKSLPYHKICSQVLAGQQIQGQVPLLEEIPTGIYYSLVFADTCRAGHGTIFATTTFSNNEKID